MEDTYAREDPVPHGPPPIPAQISHNPPIDGIILCHLRNRDMQQILQPLENPEPKCRILQSIDEKIWKIHMRGFDHSGFAGHECKRARAGGMVSHGLAVAGILSIARVLAVSHILTVARILATGIPVVSHILSVLRSRPDGGGRLSKELGVRFSGQIGV